MYFALIKDLKGMDFYGDIPEIFGAPTENYSKHELSEQERDFLMNDFVDSINELCGTLLDFGDVEYFDCERCRYLVEWLNHHLVNINDEKQRELYTLLLNYSKEAIIRKTGIVIEL